MLVIRGNTFFSQKITLISNDTQLIQLFLRLIFSTLFHGHRSSCNCLCTPSHSSPPPHSSWPHTLITLSESASSRFPIDTFLCSFFSAPHQHLPEVSVSSLFLTRVPLSDLQMTLSSGSRGSPVSHLCLHICPLTADTFQTWSFADSVLFLQFYVYFQDKPQIYASLIPTLKYVH